jgi:aspartyl protease family protein
MSTRVAASLAIALSVLLGSARVAAAAGEVQVVAVTPGVSAEIVIRGGTPLTIHVGDTVEGVTLLEAQRRGAVLRIDGETKTLPLAAYRGPSVDAASVTLAADGNGHFFAQGDVNGTIVPFVVDTGATLTALSRSAAERIGLDYSRGTPIQGMTANGAVRGWRVSLDSVRIGSAIERNVEAVVVDNDSLPVALLGMSYLNRFDMHRQGSTLVLRRRR